MKAAIDALKKAIGTYRGEGINHENENFIGTFRLQEVLAGRGFQIFFEAVATNNPSISFHAEHSTIAFNSQNGLSLFNLNTNIPFMAVHQLVEGPNPYELIFRFGDIGNQNSFREEVRLNLNGENVRYEYHWGLPGGEFAYRSGATMSR